MRNLSTKKMEMLKTLFVYVTRKYTFYHYKLFAHDDTERVCMEKRKSFL